MGQLDRLSALDATFLHQERGASHMHIGGVAVFDGPCPGLEEFIAHLDARLGGLPRYRQKLAFGRLGPRWVDDDAFDLHYHVRAAALPSPAGDLELAAFVAQIASQRLDRTRPLWEAYLIETGPDRFALAFKSHHAMVDGVSNFDLATVLLDLEPGGAGAGFGHSTGGGWSPQPAPTRGDLLLADARDAVDSGRTLAGRALGAALRPDRAVRDVVEVGKGVSELAWAAMNPAPATPLNVEISPHRRYAVVHQALADYKTVKDAFGGTVNDVVLTVVAGALRAWLITRGVDVAELELRALVPVSVRGEDSGGQMGNQLSMLRAPLPVYVNDPVSGLGVVGEAMRGIKESRQAVAASTLAAAAEVAPPAILAQASRLQFSTRLFNLLVTNIPGPQFPLYLLGRRATSLYPLPFLAEHHGLAVAIISYDGQVEYGLLGDYDALGDLDVIAAGIEVALEELLAAAAASSAVRHTRTQRTTKPEPKPKPKQPSGAEMPADDVKPSAAGGRAEAHEPSAAGRRAKGKQPAFAESPAAARQPAAAESPAAARQPAGAERRTKAEPSAGAGRRTKAEQSAAEKPARGRKPSAAKRAMSDEEPAGTEPDEITPADIPLMGSTTRRRSGPGSDMRAKRHSS